MPIIFVLYCLLGLFQLAAFFEGIEQWLGFGWIVAMILFFIAASVPLGSIATAALAFYGANHGWHWPWWQAALLAFPFPIVALISMALQGSGTLAGMMRQRQ
ncbi:hypothetical protein ACVWW6_006019 [Bradyrhizobium sp. USDA 3311]